MTGVVNLLELIIVIYNSYKIIIVIYTNTFLKLK